MNRERTLEFGQSVVNRKVSPIPTEMASAKVKVVSNSPKKSSFHRRAEAKKQTPSTEEDLDAAHLDAAHLHAAHLDAAHLHAAHLHAAHLDAAHLHAAHLDAAHLDAAHLDAAHLHAAHLDAAHLHAAPGTHLEIQTQEETPAFVFTSSKEEFHFNFL